MSEVGEGGAVDATPATDESGGEIAAGDRPFPWGDEDETPEAPQPGDPGYATRSGEESLAQEVDPQYSEGESIDGDANAEPAEGEAEAAAPAFEWTGDNGLRVALDENGSPMVYGVKADGQTYDVPIDELARGYARTAATTRKFQELAQKRKHAEGVLRIFQEAHKTGDYHRLGSVLKQVGIDANAMFEGWAEQQLREMNMTPEERFRLQMERKDAEHARERQKWEAEHRERAIAMEAQREQAHLEQAIPQALERVGLGNDPQAMGAVIDAMLEAGQHGYSMTPIEAAQMVAERMQKSTAQRLPDDPAEIMRLLGPERLAAIRKAEVQRVRQAPPQRAAPAPSRRDAEPSWIPMPDNPDDLRALFDGKG